MGDMVVYDNGIQGMIFTFRGKQVLLDRDLAMLYEVETKVLNQAVKRNIERFPEDFRFQLNDQEKNQLVTKCDRFKNLKHSSSNPYVFTELGVSMLSAILKSKIAIDVSINIIRAFVEMRGIMASNNSIIKRVERTEDKLIEYDKNFQKIFKLLEQENIPPQGIFYNGQIYDAYAFVNNLLKSAMQDIVLIDNYLDDTVLTIFSKYPHLHFTIITRNITKKLKLDTDKYNAQYKNLTLKTSKSFHDRFLIIDKDEVYHIGASLKDLGKKIFAFSRMDIGLIQLSKI